MPVHAPGILISPVPTQPAAQPLPTLCCRMPQGLCYPTAPVMAILTDECVDACNATNINFHGAALSAGLNSRPVHPIRPLPCDVWRH